MWRAHTIWALGVVGSTIALLTTAASNKRDGACNGIALGCEPEVIAFFAALIIVPVAVLVLLIGHVVIAAVGVCHR